MALSRPWLLGTLAVVVLVTLGSLLAFYIPATCLTCSKDRSSQACYRAAVFDHRHQVNTKAGQDSRKTDIELNLQVFESATKLAKQNSADIVVFPEYGILFGLGTREDVIKHGEYLPNEKGVPVCTDEYATKAPIIHRLACMAKTNRILVAANTIDVQNCTSSKCPSDKKLAFNTAVLFDRNGHLLAKYHKMHPFGEMTIDVPAEDDLVVVDTEIGRLSLQVCFDMIYSKPGVYLAAQGQIDTMVFPTWWFDELPLLAASQFQMAWAFGNKINLLASNIHKVEVGSKGSGIYAGGQGQFEVVSAVDAKSRLLVASLPVKPTSTAAHCPLNAVTHEVPQLVPIPSNIQYRYQSMNLTQTEVLKVDLTKSLATKCSRGVCCTLNYQVSAPSTDTVEDFYLLVTNRTRPGAYPWTEEFCVLVHCPQLENLKACSLMTSNRPLSTTFSFVEMSGDFSPDALIYPSVIGSEHKVLPKSDLWSYKEDKSTGKSKQQFVLSVGSKSSSEKAHAVSTISLYGRVYSRDPPYEQRPTGGIEL